MKELVVMDIGNSKLIAEFQREADEARNEARMHEIKQQQQLLLQRNKVTEFRQMLHQLAAEAEKRGTPAEEMDLERTRKNLWGKVINKYESEYGWVLARTWGSLDINDDPGTPLSGLEYFLLCDSILYKLRGGGGPIRSYDQNKSEAEQDRIVEELLYQIAPTSPTWPNENLYRDPDNWEREFCARILSGWFLVCDTDKYPHKWTWSSDHRGHIHSFDTYRS